MKQKMDEQRNFLFRGFGRQSITYAANTGKKSADVTGSPATMLVNVPAERREGGEARKLRLRIGFQYSRGGILERKTWRETCEKGRNGICLWWRETVQIYNGIPQMEIFNLLAVFKRVRNRGFRQNGAKKNLHAKKAFRKESRYIRVVFPLARK